MPTLQALLKMKIPVHADWQIPMFSVAHNTHMKLYAYFLSKSC